MNSGTGEDALVRQPKQSPQPPDDLPEPHLWKAGELARRAGLTRQALQQYILMGLLEPAEVTGGGHRLFDARGLERVKLIQDLNASGYSLLEIRGIFFKERTK
jgi:DNA-binding transcriptional MerR regulator